MKNQFINLVFLLSATVLALVSCSQAMSAKSQSLQQAYVTPALGPQNAPVVIIQYSSFSCGHCRDAYEKLHSILKEFPNSVQLHFKPVAFDAMAQAAGQAALAAALQGKFWEVSDLLFSNQSRFGPKFYAETALRLGLDIKKFEEERVSAEIKNALDLNMSQARALGLKGTPTVFINATMYNGDRSLEKWREAIRAELKSLGIKR